MVFVRMLDDSFISFILFFSSHFLFLELEDSVLSGSIPTHFVTNFNVNASVFEMSQPSERDQKTKEESKFKEAKGERNEQMDKKKMLSFLLV